MLTKDMRSLLEEAIENALMEVLKELAKKKLEREHTKKFEAFIEQILQESKPK